uniref:Guanylate cyclase n=1 Tax=Hirondellea gigas TaxID=1518452 RepID=A0A2P2I7Y6_9CRUS
MTRSDSRDSWRVAWPSPPWALCLFLLFFGNVSEVTTQRFSSTAATAARNLTSTSGNVAKIPVLHHHEVASQADKDKNLVLSKGDELDPVNISEGINLNLSTNVVNNIAKDIWNAQVQSEPSTQSVSRNYNGRYVNSYLDNSILRHYESNDSSEKWQRRKRVNEGEMMYKYTYGYVFKPNESFINIDSNISSSAIPTKILENTNVNEIVKRSVGSNSPTNTKILNFSRQRVVDQQEFTNRYVYSGIYSAKHRRSDTRVARFASNRSGEDEEECLIGHKHPLVAEGAKTLLLGVLMTQVGTVRERLGLKIPGAVTYAVSYVNENNILPEDYILQFQMRDTRGDVVVSTKHVTDFTCEHVNGFIGPEHTCNVEATIAAAHNLPMISYACSDATMLPFNTFSRTNPSEKPLLRVTVETLRHFNWNKFSIIYMEEFSTMAETLDQLAKHNNMTVNHKMVASHSEQFPNIISETKNATRIYVFLAHRVEVWQMLLTMSLSGLMKPGVKNEYMLIYVDREEYKPTDWVTYMFDKSSSEVQQNSTQQCLSEKEKLTTFDQTFMVIGNRAPVGTIKVLEDKVRYYNTKAPFCLGVYNNRKLYRGRPRPTVLEKKHLPYLSLSYLYDSVVQYALAVRRLYDKSGNTTVKEVARNGEGIIDQLRNHTYQSILGYSVTMDERAQSEGNYSVYFFHGHPNCSDPSMEFPCSHCLVKISDFVDYELDTNIQISLRDEPECGYDGSLCPDDSEYVRRVIAMVMGGLMVLVIFWSTIQYRKWKYEQEIAGLQWRINKKELCQFNCGYAFGSKTSLASVVSHDFHGQLYFQSLADYRGTVVCLKKIVIEHKNHKKLDLSRPVMKEIRKMREMKQDNICNLVGAYLDGKSVTLVTEYCHRGSLEDILENEDIKLDELFVASLVHDLLRGMRFLHSHYGSHGNLKSSNCVVTGRWVLQVTDYGLHDLRKEVWRNVNTEELDMKTGDGMRFLKSQLWRAPELLRENPMDPGTKEGDVYSFGIILHEIIGRQGPFAINNGEGPNYADILKDVKKGQTCSGNLRRPTLLELTEMPFGSNSHVINVMQTCWTEDPMKRTDFRSIKLQLKRMIEERRKGNLMDHIVKLLHEYSKNLEELVGYRTLELREEKRKTEDLLHRMLPPSVASCLTRNRPVEPQNFDSVTIFFSDIVGFTALCAESTPFQVVTFLDELYRMFDGIISGYDVYKVETIGDAYMVVSGLPTRNEKHAGEIASMALELLHNTKTNFVIHHKPTQTLKLRAGIHTGPVMAGVVGLSMPRYCLFGDTVNTSARLESNGLPLRIHISEQSKKALVILGGYMIEERGLVEMKGKGKVLTFWLNSATSVAIKRRDIPKVTPTTAKSPLFHEGEENLLRRRSPRVTSDMRRFSVGGRSSLASRSFDGSGDILIPRRSVREASPLSRESPKIDHHEVARRKLSSGIRASSLECTVKGGLLSPPTMKEGSPDSTRATHSLEQLHMSPDMTLEVPPAPSTSASRLSNLHSPASSEPTLLVEDAPRVNFSTNTKELNHDIDKDEDSPISPSEEIQPMLFENNCNVLEFTNGECSSTGRRHSGSVRSWLTGFMKNKPSRKQQHPMNGLHHENLV